MQKSPHDWSYLELVVRLIVIILLKHSNSSGNSTTLNIYSFAWEYSNKKLLAAPGIATRSKDATRGSWPYY